MSYTRMNVSVGGDNGSVGHIELCQPEEYNRMPPAFWEELPRALAELDATGKIRALIVSSTGKHFTSGMDVSVFTATREERWDRGRAGEAARRNLNRLQEVFSKLETVRMPVIAAIQGGCIGGGVDLIAACDMRYCSADAFFCIQEINIGLAADVGTLQRLPRLIPEGLMRELAYTGRRMYAEEAKAAGLVNEVFDTREILLDNIEKIADEIASKSPLAVTSTKHLLNYGRDHSVTDTLDYQQLWMGAVNQGKEMGIYFKAKADGSNPTYEDLPPLE
ncbi:MAG: enoyl-CoA hydratase-related protein [Gammaproteobacteria bacterium]|nr:enoyl-CoA hydratase-related protein [Gammaproteobacteria bacterium]MCZ6853434.1 enoyl-CoA hydratase-related protein [Gammaproteobacteria bacterium]